MAHEKVVAIYAVFVVPLPSEVAMKFGAIAREMTRAGREWDERKDEKDGTNENKTMKRNE